MSLSDHEARAMAVKMLQESELRALHQAEIKAGRHYVPAEVSQFSALARRDGTGIKKWWGIPEHPAGQAAHAERIKGLVTDLMRSKACHVFMGDDESRMNFDWHVFHSGIDFSYNGSSRPDSGGGYEDVFGGPADRKTVAAGG
jgi:hypothetical protein